jgi:hypothetical protein
VGDSFANLTGHNAFLQQVLRLTFADMGHLIELLFGHGFRKFTQNSLSFFLTQHGYHLFLFLSTAG